jgi:hypothetical protein
VTTRAGDRRQRPGTSFDLVESKLRAPPARPGIVPRRALVELLRARGRTVKVGAAELAMDRREARALLDAAGAGLSDLEVTELVARTEGWPVGLYLAALAHQAGGPQRPAGFAFTGTTGSSPTTWTPSCWPRSRPSRWCS